MFNLLIPAAVSAALTRLSPLSASRRGAVRMMGGFGAAQDSFKYTGRVRPGKRSPMREIPPNIVRPDYAGDGRPKARGPLLPWQIEVKSAEDIEGMRAAGRVAREVLDAAARAVEVGVSTDEIDRVVHEETTKRGAYPSPLNYHGFPKSCCTSVNEVICHGIPDSSILRDGDIINVDVTCYYGGYHGDCSETFLVGEVDDAGRQLVKVTYDCWQAAIEYCKPGKPYSGIGAIIEETIAPYGYSTVREFCGHGIGKIFHTNPNILHYKNNEPGTMEVGHVFTIGACPTATTTSLVHDNPATPFPRRHTCQPPLSHTYARTHALPTPSRLPFVPAEPMICEGTFRHVMWNDAWTATTKDGLRSAQFEHTLLVTPTGVEALTGKLPTSLPFFWEADDYVAPDPAKAASAASAAAVPEKGFGAAPKKVKGKKGAKKKKK